MSIDMEHQLRTYAEFLDSTLPVLDAEDAMVERLGDVPVRPLRERTLTPAVPGWVWAVGAAAVTVIVGVLVVVLLRLTDEQADVIQPVPTTITSPPTTVPEGSEPQPLIEPAEEEPFTADSAIGTWTWTPIDVWSEPAPPTPQAFVDGRYLSGALVSDDGLTWSEAPSPDTFIGPATDTHVFTVGETVYAVSDALLEDPGGPPGFRSRLWRYDSGSWTEMPLPEAFPPDVEGLSLGAEWPRVEVFDSTVIVMFEYTEGSLFVDDNEQAPLTEPYGLAYAVPVVDGLIALQSSIDDPEAQAFLTMAVVDGSPPRIEFRDLDTGELVHTVEATLPGLTPEELMAALYDSQPIYRAVLVSTDGGAFEQISVPWQDEVGLTSINGELLAVVNGRELWASADGRLWSRVATTGLNLQGGAGLTGGGERVFISDGVVSMTSTDGRAWQPVEDLGGLDLQRVDRVSFGWFAVAGGHFGVPLSIHMSTDGVNWQQIGAPAESFCEVAYLGDTIFANCYPGDGSVHRWTATMAEG